MTLIKGFLQGKFQIDPMNLIEWSIEEERLDDLVEKVGREYEFQCS
jgi:hypothetical protein